MDRDQSPRRNLLNRGFLDDSIDQLLVFPLETSIKPVCSTSPRRSSVPLLERTSLWKSDEDAAGRPKHNLPPRNVIPPKNSKKISEGLAKKRRKPAPRISPFHNYQKHLSVALKNIVRLPMLSSESSPFEIAAVRLWTCFMACDLPSKKYLHFIFNEKNQHVADDATLEKMVLLEVYRSWSKEDLSEARNYLSTVVADQLTDENIDNYLYTRRIRNSPKFKKYIQEFRGELRSGFLKKRIAVSRQKGRKTRSDED